MRLQKYLANAGVASRRRAETYIVAGHVRVNGKVVKELGSTVAAGDRVEFAGTLVELAETKRYIVLNKPVKVMTTMRDPEGRKTVASIVPREKGHRLLPVGRLDYDTSGILLMTDDGELANVLTHPRFGVDKTYRALVHGRLAGDDMKRFIAGINLGDGDGKTAPAKLRVVRSNPASTEIDITIHEGRNRQVRRMFEATDHPVIALERLRFGPISIGSLRQGQWRELTDKELTALEALKRAAAENDAVDGEDS